MATWLEMSCSPEFSPAIFSRELRKIHHMRGMNDILQNQKEKVEKNVQPSK